MSEKSEKKNDQPIAQRAGTSGSASSNGKQRVQQDPDGIGHNKPKPSDAPSSTISTDVGKMHRITPIHVTKSNKLKKD